MHMLYKSWKKDYFICHGQQLDEKWLKWFEDIAFLWGVFVHRLNRVYNNQRQRKWLPYKSIISKIKDIGKYIMVGKPSILNEKIRQICIQQKADGFICGHLHHPVDMYIDKFHYLNSWDRVESMTALAETPDHQRCVLYH